MLTVSDGVHSDRINFKGNYVGSTWTAASDGRGGVVIIDPKAPSAGAFAHAMASLPSSSSGASAMPAAMASPATRPLVSPPG